MRKYLTMLLAAVALTLIAPPIASAEAQLVMVDLNTCTYCAKFRSEVAPTYDTTDAGKVAPLRKVSPLKRWPEDLAGIRPAPYTPVFILVEDGREVGRFAGYTTQSNFWAQLKPLMGRL